METTVSYYVENKNKQKQKNKKQCPEKIKKIP